MGNKLVYSLLAIAAAFFLLGCIGGAAPADTLTAAKIAEGKSCAQLSKFYQEKGCFCVASAAGPDAKLGFICTSTLPEDSAACAAHAKNYESQKCGSPLACYLTNGGVETCDGIDNDCDRQVDESLSRGCSTACGSGTEACSNGQWGACSAPQPQQEVCTGGADEDCDGVIDCADSDCSADAACAPQTLCRGTKTTDCYDVSAEYCQGSYEKGASCPAVQASPDCYNDPSLQTREACVAAYMVEEGRKYVCGWKDSGMGEAYCGKGVLECGADFQCKLFGDPMMGGTSCRKNSVQCGQCDSDARCTTSDDCYGAGTCNADGYCSCGGGPTPPSCSISESGACTDGQDNDCDGATDCADSECLFDSACAQPPCHANVGSPCIEDSECCESLCIGNICTMAPG